MMPLLGVLMLIGLHLDTSVVHASNFSVDDLKVLATGIATAHNLNVKKFLSTLENESHWEVNAKGDYVKGKPTSFGLCQFHYPERDWDMTIEEAYQPLTCMEKMANAWEEGKQRRWSGYSL